MNIYVIKIWGITPMIKGFALTEKGAINKMKRLSEQYRLHNLMYVKYNFFTGKSINHGWHKA